MRSTLPGRTMPRPSCWKGLLARWPALLNQPPMTASEPVRREKRSFCFGVDLVQRLDAAETPWEGNPRCRSWHMSAVVPGSPFATKTPWEEDDFVFVRAVLPTG
jgi:hypothetical protein